MRMVPRTTLEQWAVLQAVVEHGTFAAAATALHRSQSSVSYALARLQEGLGLELLAIAGRRAVLTEAGRSLLSNVRPLIDDLARAEARAIAITGGEVVRVRLAVDMLFPKKRLFSALSCFAALHPGVEIYLRETVRQGVTAEDGGGYDLAVVVAEPGSKDVNLLVSIEMIAVVAKHHALSTTSDPPTKAALARHARVEIRGAEPSLDDRQGGLVWRMNTVDAAIDAVRAGLCYGWLPAHLIADDLRTETLKRLPLGIGGLRRIPLGLRIADTPTRDAKAIVQLARLLSDLPHIA